jgi:hypothetical protein
VARPVLLILMLVTQIRRSLLGLGFYRLDQFTIRYLLAAVEAVGLWDASVIRVPSACASNP